MIPDIWSYLSHGPLLWLGLTLGAYLVGDAIFTATGRNPLANPVLLAIGILAAVLLTTGTDYDTYFEGAQFVHFLLGPATVCLAVPLYANIAHVRRTALPMAAALLAGALVAMVSALGLARLFGLDGAVLTALTAKSVTAPVAIGIAERIGGPPTLTAALVLITGVTGGIIVTPLLNALRVRDWRARGFAAGVAAHGIGTARALQVHQTAGAFAGIGMALNAMLTSLLAPWVLALFR
ncbi:LrgB family protein [Pseudoroseicyclus aestuarii]|uniref:Putative murein hydrolase (TIGR00659 family) n=1 Tax=Pseudoroseicyclus aestuarii TaxID=1795041 RepID=A0A318T988_9RHOB|nr:LrgB family protein [Pseudoroseicyclus aestuarii]PYE84908.1 putative murein hydrolase (TIGR00659 family) [Pseudoroseicyclus aestuarii]